MHLPIRFNHVCLRFPHKVCFEDFSAEVSFGQHIGILGRNGSGKTSLLQMLLGTTKPSEGEISIPDEVRLSFVPQVIEEFQSHSGGERLNRALSQALAVHPNVLLLDEPTNHLDLSNRKSLLRMLRSYSGTLILVSHDVFLLRNVVDTLWHIDQERITAFSGRYDDYMAERKSQRASLEQKLVTLDREKKAMHQALMKEQGRAKKSRLQGEKNIRQRKWPTIVSDAKARRAEETSGRKKNLIHEKKQEINEKLSQLAIKEEIHPSFSLNAGYSGDKKIVFINEAALGYGEPVLTRINLVVGGSDRVAILGDNGSGKTTLFKAILQDPTVQKSGTFQVPKIEDIGYLDQHYGTLKPEKTVLETLTDLVPRWTHADIRKHLNDFLFRKNEEVHAQVKHLSGGEKVRLCFAQIAAKTPRLLLLDEITNNLDLETKEHVTQVLRAFPRAMLLISHDEAFLDDIGIERIYTIRAGQLLAS